MSDKTQRIITILLYILFAISIIFTVIFYSGKVVEGTEGTNFEEPVVTNLMLKWGYLLFIIAAAATLFFSVYYLVTHPKQAVRALIVLGAVVVVVLIAYLFASDVPLNMATYEGTDNVPRTLKWVGTGMNVTIILGIVAFVTMIASEVIKAFK